MIDAHHAATAHADDCRHGHRFVQPDVHDSDFGLRCPVRGFDYRFEAYPFLE